MDENNKFPFGWGDAEDEEDYGFSEEEEDSPWAAESASEAPSAFEADEPIEDEITQQPEVQEDAQSAAAPAMAADAARIQAVSAPKKSPLVAVLVSIIVVLAAGGGVLGGMLLTQNQGNTADHTADAEPSETDAASMESVPETATVPAASPTEAETETTAATVPYEVYEEASIRAMDVFLQSYYLGTPEDPYYLESVMYSLIDINEDGVPELLIEYQTEVSENSSLYIYDGSDYKEYENLYWGVASVCTSEHLIQICGYEGATVRNIYEMDADGNISLKDEIFCNYGYSDAYYTLNSEEISSSEYDEINSYYDSLQWETIDRYEYRHSGTDLPVNTEPSSSTEETTIQAEIPLVTEAQPSYTNADLCSAYVTIASEIEAEVNLSGVFLTDMDADGYEEMILPDPKLSSYRIYFYEEGQIISYAFGTYQALGNFVLYEVSGDSGQKYIYYRDECYYKSYQGYFNPEAADSLDIKIDYPFADTSYYADWSIIYHHAIYDTIVSSGYEQVETFYAQPANCHDALLSAFISCGFAISEDSRYTSIDPITLDALKEKANR